MTPEQIEAVVKSVESLTRENKIYKAALWDIMGLESRQQPRSIKMAALARRAIVNGDLVWP